ncbi:MAG: GGDEF domain-containing protein [Gammaproteobacteria bacterium]|nr:GGDEF domain-containing protein [Gammaproteobacteria bacterium]
MEDIAPKPPETTDSRVEVAQIAQGFQHLPISLSVNLVNGLILVAVLWSAASAGVLLLWLLLLVGVTAARFALLRAFREARRQPSLDAPRWRRRFVVGACAAGVTWGLSGVILFHPTSFPHQVFHAFVLGGMLAGAVPLLSSIANAYRCFAIPIGVPITLMMLSVGDQVHVIMSLLMAIFTAAMLASSAQVERLFREAENLQRRLLTSLETGHALEHMVRLDPLTEIPNRRLLEEALAREWARAKREQTTLAVITADIDYFKEFNDNYGHHAGDRCLIAVAQALQQTLSRPGDVVARVGGEEFAFLLPRTTLDGARAVAEQMRDAILALQLRHDASPVHDRITLSFGVASSEAVAAASAAELLRASDAALYDAKRRGRNRIATATA